ncbi:hypothetical protein WA026_015695 [Henosepilachna vigintioctopunctata]|uniref:Uncharacterized protein n=1 Tax=Henosepilachna vigintioctopunctata TaxID=420089 RepID=A0AAW1UYK6_9CUCU
MKYFLTLCNLLVCVMAPGPITDYCFLTCHYSYFTTHIVCNRLHSCPKPKKCEMYEANKQWREIMLHILNDARNGAANGSKKFNFGNTGAKNMYALSYDIELEYIITCVLNDCNPGPWDGCLQTIRFTPYGFGIIWYALCEFDMTLWRSITKFPDGEIISFNSETDEGIRNPLKYGDKFHHFKVLYAWNAKYVGCTAVKRQKEKETQISCLIGPGIDKKGDIIYKVAKHPNEIASECEEGRNRKYPALCGNIDEVSAEEMWSNLNITFNSSRKVFHVDNLCRSIMIYLFICTLFEI